MNASNPRHLGTNRRQDLPIDLQRCGERLQRDLRFDSSHPSQYLQSLLDELEKRETTRATPTEAAGRPSAG